MSVHGVRETGGAVLEVRMGEQAHVEVRPPALSLVDSQLRTAPV